MMTKQTKELFEQAMLALVECLEVLDSNQMAFNNSKQFRRANIAIGALVAAIRTEPEPQPATPAAPAPTP